ncbi:hypothetical protein HBZS_109640 [Helicobacter bizzozeronii CCUG 35545]|nr:hypothetical protein HBZS_109640 [Helicobacter bizzozeronii CCUG 35545]
MAGKDNRTITSTFLLANQPYPLYKNASIFDRLPPLHSVFFKKRIQVLVNLLCARFNVL